jgi:hypothetical protein
MQQNLKANPTDNAEKDPQDWVTGDEPMTGRRRRTLRRYASRPIYPDDSHQGRSIRGDRRNEGAIG